MQYNARLNALTLKTRQNIGRGGDFGLQSLQRLPTTICPFGPFVAVVSACACFVVIDLSVQSQNFPQLRWNSIEVRDSATTRSRRVRMLVMEPLRLHSFRLRSSRRCRTP